MKKSIFIISLIISIFFSSCQTGNVLSNVESDEFDQEGMSIADFESTTNTENNFETTNDESFSTAEITSGIIYEDFSVNIDEPVVEYAPNQKIISATSIPELLAKLSIAGISNTPQVIAPNSTSLSSDQIYSLMFNNELLYFDDYEPYAVRLTQNMNGSSVRSEVFRISWHQKNCTNSYHGESECLLFWMKILVLHSNTNPNYDVGHSKRTYKGKEYLHTITATYNSHIIYVNDHITFSFETNRWDENLDGVIERLLDYGFELQELAQSSQGNTEIK